MSGFVEHFENDVQTAEQEESVGLESLETPSQVHRAIQLQILKLLSSGIDLPAPNIAHLLLGFEMGSGKHIAETTLQDPGID